jgi:hypothetical protein
MKKKYAFYEEPKEIHALYDCISQQYICPSPEGFEKDLFFSPDKNIANDYGSMQEANTACIELQNNIDYEYANNPNFKDVTHPIKLVIAVVKPDKRAFPIPNVKKCT